MDHEHLLEGGCSCGRNRYVVQIPRDSSHVAQVFFDNSRVARRSQATPLSAWLRVPLAWYQSTTQAFMEDETHSSIRRTYTSPHEQNCKRQFCGFCGTPLSYWSEEPASEADYISLTIGSLAGKDLRDLEDLGLLPKEALEDSDSDRDTIVQSGHGISVGHRDAKEGLPWFETMVEGSRLGKMKKSWAKHHDSNGRYHVEWEITEFTIDDEPTTPGKRKVGVLEEDDSGTGGVH